MARALLLIALAAAVVAVATGEHVCCYVHDTTGYKAHFCTTDDNWCPTVYGFSQKDDEKVSCDFGGFGTSCPSHDSGPSPWPPEQLTPEFLEDQDVRYPSGPVPAPGSPLLRGDTEDDKVICCLYTLTFGSKYNTSIGDFGSCPYINGQSSVQSWWVTEADHCCFGPGTSGGPFGGGDPCTYSN